MISVSKVHAGFYRKADIDGAKTDVVTICDSATGMHIGYAYPETIKAIVDAINKETTK